MQNKSAHFDIVSKYQDIIKGVSYILSDDVSVFVPHLTSVDVAQLGKKYHDFVDEAVAEGIEKEEDQIAFIISQGWWNQHKETEIAATLSMIDRFQRTLSQMTFASQREGIRNQMAGFQQKVVDLKSERSKYISVTAEKWADTQLINWFVSHFLYEDESCKVPIFSEQEFGEIEEDDVIKYYKIYYRYLGLFNDTVIKKIAASHFFQNMFYICEDSPYVFYGKPIVQLTKNQADLFMYGKMFRNMIKNSSRAIPDEILEDPDKFIEWFDSDDRLREQMAKAVSTPNSVGRGSTFMFAEPSDLKQMGLKDQTGALLKRTKAAGGLGIREEMENRM